MCNICSKKTRTFISLNNESLICPSCGSLSRNRRLWSLLHSNNDFTGTMLHFSPSRSIYRKLKIKKNLKYFSTDFENEFLADYKFDITNINQVDNKFDTIICYHILEHIKEDKKAMAELHRVLKPKGTLYIQTPFKAGDTYEDDAITSPEERLKHFGQHDHVRIYSVDGLKNRLEHHGFKVSVKTYPAQKDDFYLGLQSPETILIATK
ncbi:methyltransferase domain-containing protein [Mariniflexile ostreae]|uniref:Methyltransferase domain-containing protein n=1 Tax=Mariniflexile ostreae TaxID=1520892 RepID=A0ABV5FEZ0_9FLAO